jgi:hypothetical protein
MYEMENYVKSQYTRREFEFVFFSKLKKYNVSYVNTFSYLTNI